MRGQSAHVTTFNSYRGHLRQPVELHRLRDRRRRPTLYRMDPEPHGSPAKNRSPNLGDLPVHQDLSRCFNPDANSSAFFRSSAFGLPLFIPPKNLRKLLVLKPLQLNSPTMTYPFASSFPFRSE